MNNCDHSLRDISDLIEIRTASDCSVILYVNDAKLGLDKSNALIGLLTKELLSNRPAWLREYIPSYTSLLIEYSLFDTDHLAVNRFLRQLINSSLSHIGALLEGVMDENKQSGIQDESSTLHKIPVCYELSIYESDLQKVASDKALTTEAVIAMHCAVCYRVFATGFLPGFAYLGELPEELSQARLNNPRSKVQKGAVAIADRQTAIYPDESPGGWHILGYTPINLLIHNNQQRSAEVTPLLRAGDYVEFFPITEKQYLNWHSE